jgi:hypothetical protein
MVKSDPALFFMDLQDQDVSKCNVRCQQGYALNYALFESCDNSNPIFLTEKLSCCRNLIKMSPDLKFLDKVSSEYINMFDWKTARLFNIVF